MGISLSCCRLIDDETKTESVAHNKSRTSGRQFLNVSREPERTENQYGTTRNEPVRSYVNKPVNVPREPEPEPTKNTTRTKPIRPYINTTRGGQTRDPCWCCDSITPIPSYSTETSDNCIRDYNKLAPSQNRSSQDSIFHAGRRPVKNSQTLNERKSTDVPTLPRPSTSRQFVSAHDETGIRREHNRAAIIRPLSSRTAPKETNVTGGKGFRNLSPSKIRYSQDSIATTFYDKGRHGGVKIGQTLDDLLSGKIEIKDIPRITVCWYQQHWFSFDNRRLWVLKNYERIVGYTKIKVNVTDDIDEKKLTTDNQGTEINVRGNPGGQTWKDLIKRK